MKRIGNIFNRCLKPDDQRGGMMVELLLTMSLVAVILPFLVNFHRSRIERATSIAVAADMTTVQAALERYIGENRKELLAPVGKNITRVRISDLTDYGVPTEIIEQYGDRFQTRVLKSATREGHATIQGIVILNDDEISPMRTRQIVNLGGDRMGFIEDNQAFGAFGTWRASAIDLGITGVGGIVDMTKTTIDDEEYLWRIPSGNATDATMLSALNLGGHDIVNAKFLDSKVIRFEEILKSDRLVTGTMIFQSRTTIDKVFETADATVAGTLAADSRALDVTGTMTITGTAKFSNFTVNDLWVNNLNLSGLSISAQTGVPAVLKATQAIDMIGGHINAMYATVGFAGSVTPKLVVRNRIEDSVTSTYFWDASENTARFSDVQFAELNRMAPMIAAKENAAQTAVGQIFKTVATNKNATAADFINAIHEIEKRVRAKYNQLNLE